MREELRERYGVLKEYEKILERKHYPHPDLKQIRAEMEELKSVLKVLDLQ